MIANKSHPVGILGRVNVSKFNRHFTQLSDRLKTSLASHKFDFEARH